MSKKTKRLGESVFGSIGSSYLEAELLKEIKLELIDPPDWQPRKKFELDKLETLKNSIKENGLLQPLVVEEITGNKYKIISGERRYRACKMLGMDFVPVRIISKPSDDKRIQIQIAENLHREDITPIERAKAVHKLFESQTQKNLNEIIVLLTTYHRDRARFESENPEIAPTVGAILRALGKSENTIIRWLKLLQLPESLQELLDDPNGVFTPKHAGEILKIKDAKKQLEIASLIESEGLSVERTREVVNKSTAPKTTSEITSPTQFIKSTERWLLQSENFEFERMKREQLNQIQSQFARVQQRLDELESLLEEMISK